MNILDYIGIPKAFAETTPVATFVGKINRYITNPLITLLFAAALVLFLYGVFNFISGADETEKRDVGKRHMLWGIVGMFIMIATSAILRIIENTLGIPHNANLS